VILLKLKIAVSKTLSDFALEFRTARERAIENEERQKKKRDRNNTRGRKITNPSNCSFEVNILDKNKYLQ